ncbi:methyltransferase domain-containing protein [candidate division GN15 bacterium]|nr:methyltransferase domain-containing protein [candidate division GN15 bacterium]
MLFATAGGPAKTQGDSLVSDYYRKKLSARRLEQVYQIAPARIQQYLQAEIECVVSRLKAGITVLELGCGYGRVMPALAVKASTVVGIDNSLENLLYAKQFLSSSNTCSVAAMDVTALGFADETFDCVVCIQNGLSAFQIDPAVTMRESLRVTRQGGRCIFTSYASAIWEARLEWFKLQAEVGLLGRIDCKRTGDGVIVCEDGFRATTISPQQFGNLARELSVSAVVTEVDESSVVCEVIK